MTVAELIEALRDQPQDKEVVVWDDDKPGHRDVTGARQTWRVITFWAENDAESVVLLELDRK